MLLRLKPKLHMNRGIGILVIVGGICLTLLGLLMYSGGLSWFGKLPGDIHYEGEHTQVYIPLVSMLIVSLALSLIFYLLRRFF
jgi:formate hydrogenlyase subunit 3/multisubunit Na+/H+ antiporter MnhD subunit